MTRRGKVCRVVADGVGVVVSTLVICVLGALVQPAVGASLFVAGFVTVVALACGRGEVAAVRLLARSRMPRDYELAALRPAIAVLEEFELTSPVVQLLVRGGQPRVRGRCWRPADRRGVAGPGRGDRHRPGPAG